jgi:hypothetical protein
LEVLALRPAVSNGNDVATCGPQRLKTAAALSAPQLVVRSGQVPRPERHWQIASTATATGRLVDRAFNFVDEPDRGHSLPTSPAIRHSAANHACRSDFRVPFSCRAG